MAAHGDWQISKDFGQMMIKVVHAYDYDAVIEFGSGRSTLVLAKAITGRNNERELQSAPIQAAFEHLEGFHRLTNSSLKAASLHNRVDLCLAPLISYETDTRQIFHYYDCQAKLSSISARLTRSQAEILVVVDGPPGTTGQHARYPALPILLRTFPSAWIDFLLDDYGRPQEQEVGNMWADELRKCNRPHRLLNKKLERGALFVQVAPEGIDTFCWQKQHP